MQNSLSSELSQNHSSASFSRGTSNPKMTITFNNKVSFSMISVCGSLWVQLWVTVGQDGSLWVAVGSV